MKGKQVVISLSSSEDEEDDDQDEESGDESDEDYEEEEEESEQEGEEEESRSEDCGGSSDGEDDDDDDQEGKRTDEELNNRVIDLLQRRKSLNVLKLEECKAYLRKHGLRLSGTKATCIERILEHWRIKDGNGDKLYPKSSFVINCTGDVCKGDVILFKQRVYEKFDIARKGGNVIGKRMIAGRVLKESYGGAKQQHTFTVEILWSKGVKSLPPLFPLLVKGRNLYRLKTFRQRWSNEMKRSIVLAEKHKRGAAARHTRAIAKASSTNRGSKRQRSSSSSKAPCGKRRKKDLEPTIKKKNKRTHSAKAASNGNAKVKQVAKIEFIEPSATQPKQANHRENGIHTQRSIPQRNFYDVNHYHPQMEMHQRSNIGNMAVSQSHGGYIPNYSTGCSSATGMPHHHLLSRENFISHPYGNPTSHFYPGSSNHPYENPASQFAQLKPRYSYENPTTVFEPRRPSHLSRQVDFYNGYPGGQFPGWRP